MTAPRRIVQGTTYLITRRCTQRQFLLRPSRSTNEIFRYVLAVAARRFGIEVHAYCVLSNHWHAVVTDPHARLPAFEQYVNALVARAVNASLGRWESFWAPASYSAVTLTSAADIVEKAAYVLANPVAAGLVKHGHDWPGLWSAPESIGGPATIVERPATFFRRSGYMPEKVALELVAPPGYSAEEFQERLAAALAEREERARSELASEGRVVLGVQKVLAQRPTARPPHAEPRRGLNPRVAGRDKWKRIEALSRLVEFLREYRVAWRAMRAEKPTPVFPAGTYLMRVAYGVRCAELG
jgi:REP element-mobilizing transposase RayT